MKFYAFAQPTSAYIRRFGDPEPPQKVKLLEARTELLLGFYLQTDNDQRLRPVYVGVMGRYFPTYGPSPYWVTFPEINGDIN